MLGGVGQLIMEPMESFVPYKSKSVNYSTYVERTTTGEQAKRQHQNLWKWKSKWNHDKAGRKASPPNFSTTAHTVEWINEWMKISFTKQYNKKWVKR